MAPYAPATDCMERRSDSPNEKFSLSSFHGGTKSVAYLYEELAKGT